MSRWMNPVTNCVPEYHGKELSASCHVLTFVRYFLLIPVIWVFFPAWIGEGQAQTRINLSIPEIRSSYVKQLAAVNRAVRIEAEVWARAHGFPVWHDDGVNVFGLMYLRDNRPVYYITENVNAAITTAADKVRHTAPYNLDGSGFTIGVWDGGGILRTHQEFGSRIHIIDGAFSPSDHATHVAGTIGAAGIDPRALGMAPGVNVDSYDFEGDTDEMAQRGASIPDEQDKIYVSNHSYGPGCGWRYTNISGDEGWHWLSGVWKGPDSTGDLFGQYDRNASQWDEVAFGAPYYLIFTSAGNHRTDNPASQEPVYYWSDRLLAWQNIPYRTTTCPPGDGVVKKGYDTIAGKAVAKNVMTVGSVSDAINRDRGRNLSNARMSRFSSWGPADDGRIKPDIVANGENLFSPIGTKDSAYSNESRIPFSGTSMSAPNASGSAILLVHYYNELFPEQAMRSSTLKGLILHTADDLGIPGPDYRFGWGLMNTEAAAQVIKQHHDNPSVNRIAEANLHARNRVHIYNIDADGTSPVRATLCWTDPPASAVWEHDDPSPRLVNDLDLRVFGPDGSVFYPFVLNPTKPSAPATTGDNTLDNTEQVIIEVPLSGSYTVQVSFKGMLENVEQAFSLILSGISVPGAPPAPSDPVPADGATDVPIDTMLFWSGNDDLFDSPWASWYVFFGTSPNALEQIFEDLSEPACDPGILSFGTTYHWQIIAKHDDGITHGSIWSFTTQNQPIP
ncbi:S8 family serine peptidase [Planctomycetota bacterium]